SPVGPRADRVDMTASPAPGRTWSTCAWSVHSGRPVPASSATVRALVAVVLWASTTVPATVTVSGRYGRGARQRVRPSASRYPVTCAPDDAYRVSPDIANALVAPSGTRNSGTSPGSTTVEPVNRSRASTATTTTGQRAARPGPAPTGTDQS